MQTFNVDKGNYQYRFLYSEAKFPCLISAVGTGKTMLLINKIVNYCAKYKRTTGLIVRKEFTDLRDSTMVDFEKYYEEKIPVDKNYRLDNGSLIMFRHADELRVLKNLNLGICGIEQAEEFDDDTPFQFLRDRMRQNNGANVCPICVIANANGHNWVWRLWINGAKTVNTINSATGEFEYINDVYHCLTANSFANEKNLREDFVQDLRRKEIDAPAHYRRYVLNSFEETESDDLVYRFSELMEAKKEISPSPGYGLRIAGFDVARYGADKSACVVLQQVNRLHWMVVHSETWEHKDLDYTTGRIINLSKQHNAERSIIDVDGLGSGPFDSITCGHRLNNYEPFRNPVLDKDKNPDYVNPRTAAAYKLKEYISRGWIGGLTEEIVQEMMTVRFKYANDGRKILISKEEMRNKYKIKSPNLFDSLCMAASLIDSVKDDQDRQYTHFRQPQYSSNDNWNPFKELGLR